MGLQRRKRHIKLGGPEGVGLAFAGVALSLASLWWRSETVRDWQSVMGHVTQIERAPADSRGRFMRVIVDYQYAVDGVPYPGHWEGDFPYRLAVEDETPAADVAASLLRGLDAETIAALEASELPPRIERDMPVKVVYSAANPRRSALYAAPFRIEVIYPWLSVLALIGVIAYFVRVYPRYRT